MALRPMPFLIYLKISAGGFVARSWTTKIEEFVEWEDHVSDSSKRAQEARERAEKYKTQYGHHENDRPEKTTKSGMDRRPLDLDHWSDIVGQRVEEAMRQGYFDNLPGRGQPLNLNKNPFVPADRQMANMLLENNDLVPAWIDARKSVLQAIDAFRSKLFGVTNSYISSKHTMRDPADAEKLSEEWAWQVGVWRAESVVLNRQIEVVNLEQPVPHLEIFKLDFAEELRKAGGDQMEAHE